MKPNISNYYINNHVFKIRDFLLDLLFPIECISCHKEGRWLCNKCFDKIILNKNLYCLNCKTINLFGEFCPACYKEFCLNGLWITSHYDNEVVSELIRRFKYLFIKDISNILAKLQTSFLKNIIQKNIKQNKVIHTLSDLQNSLIIPVPLPKKRQKWRGYNQAEELARIISHDLNINLNTDLKRIKNNKPQSKMTAKQRKQNLKGCFMWTSKNLKNKNIILIDDVTTTGSTLNECAKVLKKSGAGEIWGLVVAND